MRKSANLKQDLTTCKYGMTYEWQTHLSVDRNIDDLDIAPSTSSSSQLSMMIFITTIIFILICTLINIEVDIGMIVMLRMFSLHGKMKSV